MPSSAMIYSHMWIEKRLSDFEIQGICGALVHGLPWDKPMKASQFVKPLLENRFKLGRLPQTPIVKFGKKVHIENFFDTGRLQLGSFKYFNAFDHDEIGDAKKGVSL